jgi:hypothetical protein
LIVPVEMSKPASRKKSKGKAYGFKGGLLGSSSAVKVLDPHTIRFLSGEPRLQAITAKWSVALLGMLQSSVMDRVRKKKILHGDQPAPPTKKTAESLPKTVARPAYRFAVCAQYVK